MEIGEVRKDLLPGVETVFLGSSFEGDIYEIDTEDITSIRPLDEQFSDTGFKSFMKLLSVPSGFYKKRSEPVRRDILFDVKQGLRQKTEKVWALTRNGVVEYMSMPSIIDSQDLSQLVDLCPANGWILRGEDLNQGVRSYVYRLTDYMDAQNFLPCIYLNAPVLNSGKFDFSLGYYREVCSNGLMDTVWSTKLSLKEDDFSVEAFPAIVGGFSEVLKMANTSIIKFQDDLKSTAVLGVEPVRAELEDIDESGQLPSKLVSQLHHHLDLLEGEKEVPLESPKEITNDFDVLNLFTYYARSYDSLKAQSRCEGKIFEYFCDSRGGSLVGTSLKRLYNSLAA